ncbi:MAG TPA: ATP-binding cassette domain-containing protein [Saprospiraceae bacterium]|nr:ATP-binding cassette domain-containing protein [Saprospiraceae bacterium]
MDIRIQHLTKRYGAQTAVNNIDFEVKTGEILGFLGPNGAGKTTTMKMIAGYLAPDEGDIQIGGQSILEHDMRRHIGYLPENNPLYLDMPVMDYLEYCAALHGVPRDETPDRIRKMVALCGLNVEKHKRIGELSKGYRQRTGLAQAMIHDPEILILDEPTTGLDPNQIVEIRKLIRDIGKEKTVILSTHILPEVEATCDRILIINRGNIAADGTADMLRKQAQGRQVLHVRIEGTSSSEEMLRALQPLPGVEAVEMLDAGAGRFELQCLPDAQTAREVFQICVRRQWILTELVPFETKLEDVFRNLTMN